MPGQGRDSEEDCCVGRAGQVRGGGARQGQGVRARGDCGGPLEAISLAGQHLGLRRIERRLRAASRLRAALETRASWSEIGEALGVSKQAVWKSYNEDV